MWTVKGIFKVILLTGAVTAFRPVDRPKISVTKWLTVETEEEGAWENDMDYVSRDALSIVNQGSVYVVSQHIVALSITCNATYPVEWTFNHAEYQNEELHNIVLRTSRTTTDVYNAQKNVYGATLELTGDRNSVTGNYTCHDTGNRNLQRSIFVYWEGSSPPFLTLSGKTITVQSKDNNNTVVLPCLVSQPDVEVYLYQELNSSFQPVLMGNFIKFDPKIGFTINLKRAPNPYGRYRCNTEDEDDYVVIKVIPGVKGSEKFEEMFHSPAGLYFDQDREELICCSNSDKPPQLRDIFCWHPSSCRMNAHRLHKTGNNGRRTVNGSCIADKIYTKDAGIVRCKGDGIDMFKHFYTSFKKTKNDPIQLHFSWNDINPSTMLRLSAHTESPMYDKQNITFSCEALSSYFSEGVMWATKWKNDSLTFLEAEYHYDDDEFVHYHGYRSLDLNLQLGMKEVICFAPVWNTSQWVNASMKLTVRESSMPNIAGPPVEEMTFALNDTEQLIECRSSAVPTAIVTWMKNNHSVPASMIIWKSNGTSVLIFHRVSHESQGDYQCVAHNYAGEVQKIVRVFVEDPGSTWGTAAAVIVPILIIMFLVTAGYLVWKMQLQKKVLDHLTRVVFRDVRESSA